MFGTSYMVEKVACLVEKHFANHKPSNEAAALLYSVLGLFYITITTVHSNLVKFVEM